MIGGNLNPKAGLSWGKGKHEGAGAILLGLSDEESKTLNGHMDGMLDNGSGDMGIALYSAGKYPMAVSVVSGMRDGMAYRKDLLAVTDFAWKKAISVFGDEFKSDLPPGFNLDSLSGAVNSVGPLLAPMGVSVAISQDTSTDGVIVDSLTIKADIKKLVPDGQADPEMMEILNVVGDTISLSMGYGKNATAIVLSPKRTRRGQSPGEAMLHPPVIRDWRR